MAHSHAAVPGRCQSSDRLVGADSNQMARTGLRFPWASLTMKNQRKKGYLHWVTAVHGQPHKGVQPSAVSGPHWEKRSHLYMKYIATCNYKRTRNILSKFMILCWAAFTATLGCMWPVGRRLDTPGRKLDGAWPTPTDPEGSISEWCLWSGATHEALVTTTGKSIPTKADCQASAHFTAELTPPVPGDFIQLILSSDLK